MPACHRNFAGAVEEEFPAMPEMPAEITTAPRPMPDGPPPLIFNSKEGVSSIWRLLFFILCSVIGHVVMFYLFKVVTPTTTRRTPPQEEVIVLRASDPATAALLRSLEDRSPAGLLFSSGGRAEPAMLPLPAYVSSYEHYKPSIRQDWAPQSAPLLLLAEGSRPVLPAIEKGTAANDQTLPKAVPAVTGPQLVLSTALQTRGMALPPEWPKDLAAPEEATEPYQFQLAINPDGSIRYCLSDGMNPPPAIQKAVSKIRFNPAPRSPMMWEDVEVRW